jgi:hypothetical protein
MNVSPLCVPCCYFISFSYLKSSWFYTYPIISFVNVLQWQENTHGMCAFFIPYKVYMKKKTERLKMSDSTETLQLFFSK